MHLKRTSILLFLDEMFCGDLQMWSVGSSLVVASCTALIVLLVSPLS